MPCFFIFLAIKGDVMARWSFAFFAKRNRTYEVWPSKPITTSPLIEHHFNFLIILFFIKNYIYLLENKKYIEVF